MVGEKERNIGIGADERSDGFIKKETFLLVVL